MLFQKFGHFALTVFLFSVLQSMRNIYRRSNRTVCEKQTSVLILLLQFMSKVANHNSNTCRIQKSRYISSCFCVIRRDETSSFSGAVWTQDSSRHSSLAQLTQFHDVKQSDVIILMPFSRNVCTRYVNLQGVLTLHISIVQATWPAARPSGSVNVLSSPVTKSHLTPCEYAHRYTHRTSVNTAVWWVGDRRWHLRKNHWDGKQKERQDGHCGIKASLQ